MSDYAKIALGMADQNQKEIVANANKIKNVQNYSRLVDETPTIGISDYRIYQAILENPLDINLSNEHMAVFIKFQRGECINENCIEVLKNGVALPFQWEDDIHPNPRIATNMGKYSDGSLKSGYIWLLNDIPANGKLELIIKVHSTATSTTYTSTVTHNVLSSTVGSAQEELSANDVKIRFNENAGWAVRYIYSGETELVGGIVAQRTSIKNNLYADVHSTTYADLLNLTRTVVGSGVIFKDFKVSYVFKYNENIRVESTVRLWANSKFEIHSAVRILADLSAGTLNGVAFRIALQNIGEVTGTGSDGQGFKGISKDGKSLISQVKYFQFIPDNNPAENTYASQTISSNDTNFTYLNNIWYNTSPKIMAIAKDSYYSAKLLFTIGVDLSNSTETQNALNRMMNTPKITATNLTKENLINKSIVLAKSFIKLNADQAISEPNFPMLRALIQLTKNEIEGVEDVTVPYNTLKNAINVIYGGGTANGIYSVYPARGVEYIGRDMSALKPFRDKFLSLGMETDALYIESVMHALADAFIQMESYSGGDGKIILSSTVGDNMNAEAAALKFLKQSLDLQSSTVRQQCYERIKTRFESGLLYKNILPYAIGDNVFMQQLSHYHGFSIYDYMQAVDLPSFHVYNHIMDYCTPSGFIKEIGYNYTNIRWGFVHTAFYSAAVFFKVGSISTLQQACSIIEHVISRCYPNGYHEPILDGWRPNSPPSTNIECQIMCELYMGALYA